MATKFRTILTSLFLVLVLFSPIASSEENTEGNQINGGTIESDITINPDEILHISNSVTVADGVSINILNGGKLKLTGTLTGTTYGSTSLPVSYTHLTLPTKRIV